MTRIQSHMFMPTAALKSAALQSGENALNKVILFC